MLQRVSTRILPLRRVDRSEGTAGIVSHSPELLAGGKTSESERPGTTLPLREEHRSNGQNVGVWNVEPFVEHPC